MRENRKKLFVSTSKGSFFCCSTLFAAQGRTKAKQTENFFCSFKAASLWPIHVFKSDHLEQKRLRTMEKPFGIRNHRNLTTRLVEFIFISLLALIKFSALLWFEIKFLSAFSISIFFYYHRNIFIITIDRLTRSNNAIETS